MCGVIDVNPAISDSQGNLFNIYKKKITCTKAFQNCQEMKGTLDFASKERILSALCALFSV